MERYELLVCCGTGSYGSCYKVRDKRDPGTVWCVKAFKEAHTDSTALRHAMRETKLLQALKHPNIVHLQEAYRTESQRIYLVMEFVPGTLSGELRRTRFGMPPERTKHIMTQLLTAVAFLHKKQVIHRDIKPANILLHDDDTLKLCDFGFAISTRKASAGAPLTSYVVTRWYRAPEVLVGDCYGPPVDVWAVGCIFWELVTGTVLLPGRSHLDQLGLTLQTFGDFAPRQMDKLRALLQNKEAQSYVPRQTAPLDDRLMCTGFTPEMEEVLRAALHVDPLQRATAQQLLAMPYFAAERGPPAFEPSCPSPISAGYGGPRRRRAQSQIDILSQPHERCSDPGGGPSQPAPPPGSSSAPFSRRSYYVSNPTTAPLDGSKASDAIQRHPGQQMNRMLDGLLVATNAPSSDSKLMTICNTFVDLNNGHRQQQQQQQQQPGTAGATRHQGWCQDQQQQQGQAPEDQVHKAQAAQCSRTRCLGSETSSAPSSFNANKDGSSAGSSRSSSGLDAIAAAAAAAVHQSWICQSTEGYSHEQALGAGSECQEQQDQLQGPRSLGAGFVARRTLTRSRLSMEGRPGSLAQGLPEGVGYEEPPPGSMLTSTAAMYFSAALSDSFDGLQNTTTDNNAAGSCSYDGTLCGSLSPPRALSRARPPARDKAVSQEAGGLSLARSSRGSSTGQLDISRRGSGISGRLLSGMLDECLEPLPGDEQDTQQQQLRSWQQSLQAHRSLPAANSQRIPQLLDEEGGAGEADSGQGLLYGPPQHFLTTASGAPMSDGGSSSALAQVNMMSSRRTSWRASGPGPGASGAGSGVPASAAAAAQTALEKLRADMPAGSVSSGALAAVMQMKRAATSRLARLPDSMPAAGGGSGPLMPPQQRLQGSRSCGDASRVLGGTFGSGSGSSYMVLEPVDSDAATPATLPRGPLGGRNSVSGSISGSYGGAASSSSTMLPRLHAPVRPTTRSGDSLEPLIRSRSRNLDANRHSIGDLTM